MLRISSVIFWFFVKVVSTVLFYATPLIGFWLVSSLAAYLGGPPWMVWTAGAFLFPIIPGLWELHAFTHSKEGKKPILTPWDRLSLRTFAVGVVFLVVLLYLYPQTAFVALSTRGDWMLDGMKDARAERARKTLVSAAGGLQWLYDATKNNPYKSLIDPKAQQLAKEATTQLEQESGSKATGLEDGLLFHPKPLPQKPVWPWKQQQQKLHPAVATMPASAEISIKTVGSYIAAKESDHVLRVKALHDYVADRVAYDSESYFAGKYPPQDAETVFRTRKSVCAGYANLLSALADAAGEKIIVVCGDARDSETGDIAGGGHAWNAAQIDKRWYLIDATWDSGYVSREKGFTKRYQTDYLLTPPQVMIEDHFPDESTWQLMAPPLTKSEFLRQPMLDASFHSAGLVLVSPSQAKNETDSNAVAIVKNPQHQWLMAKLEENGQQLGPTSSSTNADTVRIEFPLPRKGTYRLKIYANPISEYGNSYGFVGSVDYVTR